MKLVSFSVATPLGFQTRIGVISGESIIDLNSAYAALLTEEKKTGKPYELAAAILPLPGNPPTN